MQWGRMGVDLSHRAAILTKDLEQLRSCMNQGLSVSGFRRCSLESLQNNHLRIAIQWRSYVDLLRELLPTAKRPMFLTPQALDERMVDFVDLKSDMFHQGLPSESFLIERVIARIEADSEYHTRRMQMVDGKHLSGDHSFKLAKCIVSGGSKPFTAM